MYENLFECLDVFLCTLGSSFTCNLKFFVELDTKIFVRLTFSLVDLTQSHRALCLEQIFDNFFTAYSIDITCP